MRAITLGLATVAALFAVATAAAAAPGPGPAPPRPIEIAGVPLPQPVFAQASGSNTISQFLLRLYTAIIRPIAIGAAVLFGAVGGLKLIAGRRDGMEQIGYAILGAFVVISAQALIALTGLR